MTDPSANELVGQLTLADSMLGEVVGDMRKILAYANWPGTVLEAAVGVTTGKAAEELAKELAHEAALASAALVNWIAQVAEVTEHRNRVVHAIALNQCMNCGEATMFRHPASGDDVDRSPEAVASVVVRYEALRADGRPCGPPGWGRWTQHPPLLPPGIATTAHDPGQALLQRPDEQPRHRADHVPAPTQSRPGATDAERGAAARAAAGRASDQGGICMSEAAAAG